jgi:hypothetical protein
MRVLAAHSVSLPSLSLTKKKNESTFAYCLTAAAAATVEQETESCRRATADKTHPAASKSGEEEEQSQATNAPFGDTLWIKKNMLFVFF